jgi:hypothetical protein
MADQNGVLKLNLLNVYDKPIGGTADVVCRHQLLASEVKLFSGENASKTITLPGLYQKPMGIYEIEADPSAYLPVHAFVNILPAGATPLTLTVPINPKRVTQIEFPEFDHLADSVRKLLENSGQVATLVNRKGADLFHSLDNIVRAGFLNIVAKCLHTTLPNQMNVFSYLLELREIYGDRFKVTVAEDLFHQSQNAAAAHLIDPAPEMLHQPPEGYVPVGSFKTKDHYGNLQLSFFRNPQNVYVADIDIDDAKGIEHFFQVVHNAFAGPTNPYAIHDILVGYQKLDPGYYFVV